MFDFYKMHKTRIIIAKTVEECRMIVKSNKRYCKEKGLSLIHICFKLRAYKKQIKIAGKRKSVRSYKAGGTALRIGNCGNRKIGFYKVWIKMCIRDRVQLLHLKQPSLESTRNLFERLSIVLCKLSQTSLNLSIAAFIPSKSKLSSMG